MVGARVDINPSRSGLGIFKVFPAAHMCTEAEDSLRVPGRQTGDHFIHPTSFPEFFGKITSGKELFSLISACTLGENIK